MGGVGIFVRERQPSACSRGVATLAKCSKVISTPVAVVAYKDLAGVQVRMDAVMDVVMMMDDACMDAVKDFEN